MNSTAMTPSATLQQVLLQCLAAQPAVAQSSLAGAGALGVFEQLFQSAQGQLNPLAASGEPATENTDAAATPMVELKQLLAQLDRQLAQLDPALRSELAALAKQPVTTTGLLQAARTLQDFAGQHPQLKTLLDDVTESLRDEGASGALNQSAVLLLLMARPAPTDAPTQAPAGEPRPKPVAARSVPQSAAWTGKVAAGGEQAVKVIGLMANAKPGIAKLPSASLLATALVEQQSQEQPEGRPPASELRLWTKDCALAGGDEPNAAPAPGNLLRHIDEYIAGLREGAGVAKASLGDAGNTLHALETPAGDGSTEIQQPERTTALRAIEQLRGAAELLLGRAEPIFQREGDVVSARLNLHPAELGEVRIELTFRQDRAVSAQITAQRPETAALLDQQLPRLNESLLRHGFTPDRVQVTVGTIDAASRGGHAEGKGHLPQDDGQAMRRWLEQQQREDRHHRQPAFELQEELV